jgi:hypothetical protein
MFHFDYEIKLDTFTEKTKEAFKSLRECKVISNVQCFYYPKRKVFRLLFDTFYDEAAFYSLLSGMLA